MSKREKEGKLQKEYFITSKLKKINKRENTVNRKCIKI